MKEGIKMSLSLSLSGHVYFATNHVLYFYLMMAEVLDLFMRSL